jgi:hypothetical protein
MRGFGAPPLPLSDLVVVSKTFILWGAGVCANWGVGSPNVSIAQAARMGAFNICPASLPDLQTPRISNFVWNRDYMADRLGEGVVIRKLVDQAT